MSKSVYFEEKLDHGEDFANPKLHKFLHYIKWLGESDEFAYESAIVKLAQTLGNLGDLSELHPDELYHYFQGHHKKALQDAIEFIATRDKMMNPREGNVAERYNNTWKVRDPINYTEEMNVPWAEGGWSQSNDRSPSYWNPNANPYQTFQGRASETLYGNSRPFSQTDDVGDKEFSAEKLAGNQYLRMLQTKEAKKLANKNAKQEQKFIRKYGW